MTVVRTCRHGCPHCIYVGTLRLEPRRHKPAGGSADTSPKLPVRRKPGAPLRSLCWCERKVVAVEQALVARGLTVSCGGTACEAPS